MDFLWLMELKETIQIGFQSFQLTDKKMMEI